MDELIEKIAKQDIYFNMDVLLDIVNTDKKGRYSFNEDNTKIRANQGHSIEVDVELKKAIPPKTLYHGTSTRFVNSIKTLGLIKGSRLHVHLSDNYDTAVSVGKRHGEPIVLFVDTEKMIDDGYSFYLSDNGVWLVDSVPYKYIV